MCELIARVRINNQPPLYYQTLFLAAGWNYSTPMILGPIAIANSES